MRNTLGRRPRLSKVLNSTIHISTNNGSIVFYPEPGSGTVRDSDFWLLLESSIMQCFALIIAGNALWDKTASWWSVWWWLGPTTVALMASVTTVPRYVSAPMAWSGFATTVASVVQAFMVVQLAAVRR